MCIRDRTGSDQISYIGCDVSLNADGNFILLEGSYNQYQIGAVWYLRRNALGVWKDGGERFRGAPTNLDQPAEQGWATAISADGKTLMRGAPDPNYRDGGQVYVAETCFLTLLVHVTNATREYGAEELVYALSYSVFNMTRGDTEANSINTPPSVTSHTDSSSAVGVYPLQLSGGFSSKYQLELDYESRMQITPALLLLSATSLSITRGDIIPPLSLTAAGLVNSDSVRSALTAPAVLSVNVSALSGIGRYPMYVSGGSSSNYQLRYNISWLSIAASNGSNGAAAAPYDSCAAASAMFAYSISALPGGDPVTFGEHLASEAAVALGVPQQLILTRQVREAAVCASDSPGGLGALCNGHSRGLSRSESSDSAPTSGFVRAKLSFRHSSATAELSAVESPTRWPLAGSP